MGVFHVIFWKSQHCNFQKCRMPTVFSTPQDLNTGLSLKQSSHSYLATLVLNFSFQIFFLMPYLPNSIWILSQFTMTLCYTTPYFKHYIPGFWHRWSLITGQRWFLQINHKMILYCCTFVQEKVEKNCCYQWIIRDLYLLFFSI